MTALARSASTMWERWRAAGEVRRSAMQRVERRRDWDALVFLFGLVATLLALSVTLGSPGIGS